MPILNACSWLHVETDLITGSNRYMPVFEDGICQAKIIIMESS